MELAELFVIIPLPRNMNQGAMAVHTFFFIARSRVDDGSVGQHGAALVRNVKQIAVALHALFIFKGGIGRFAIFFSIIFTLDKVNEYVFNAVQRLLIEKIKGIVGSRQMAIHAVGHKALGIVDMGGGFPGVVGRLDFVAGGAKFRGRSADHCVVAHAEQRKSDDNTDHDKNGGFNCSSPGGLSLLRCMAGLFHMPSQAALHFCGSKIQAVFVRSAADINSVGKFAMVTERRLCKIDRENHWFRQATEM
jgi:hypothetical protein